MKNVYSSLCKGYWVYMSQCILDRHVLFSLKCIRFLFTGHRRQGPSGVVWWPRKYCSKSCLCVSTWSERNRNVERKSPGLQQWSNRPAADCGHVERPNTQSTQGVCCCLIGFCCLLLSIFTQGLSDQRSAYHKYLSYLWLIWLLYHKPNKWHIPCQQAY